MGGAYYTKQTMEQPKRLPKRVHWADEEIGGSEDVQRTQIISIAEISLTRILYELTEARDVVCKVTIRLVPLAT